MMGAAFEPHARHSGMVRRDQTRNLEVSGVRAVARPGTTIYKIHHHVIAFLPATLDRLRQHRGPFTTLEPGSTLTG